jgi:uncharacterized protein YcfL
MKNLLSMLAVVALLLVSCNSKPSAAERAEIEQLNKEAEQLDSLSKQIEVTQSEIDSTSKELDKLINEL